MDALIFRIKLELPWFEEVAFCTDNSRAYNNNVLPPILPIMYKAQSVELKLYVHPDACCG